MEWPSLGQLIIGAVVVGAIGYSLVDWISSRRRKSKSSVDRNLPGSQKRQAVGFWVFVFERMISKSEEPWFLGAIKRDAAQRGLALLPTTVYEFAHSDFTDAEGATQLKQANAEVGRAVVLEIATDIRIKRLASDVPQVLFDPVGHCDLPSGAVSYRILWLVSATASCGFCGTEIVPYPSEFDGTTSVGIPPKLREWMTRGGHLCPKCGQLSCNPCSHQAAMAKGSNRFICPACRADVHDRACAV